jgi:tetratricopeptide (TPR) repeat protein/predicted Ser/Thr protein kinase
MSPPDLHESLALHLRDAVRGDLERRFGELCVSRAILSEADLRRGLEEQERLRAQGGEATLVHALARLGLVDGGPLWHLVDEVLAAPSEAPPPGRRLGRYELIREVGRGGIGTVYKAYDTRLNRVVAVKTIRLDLAEPAELTRSLVREAQMMAGLSHPNIAAVYDAGEIEGTPFLCMEYVEGGPLGELIRRPGIPPRTLVLLLRRVADALSFAHARGVVHCDLKPGNILVDRDGEPRVIDFGLARVLREKAGTGRAALPEGTPAYMAPEQVRREPGAVGPLVDVYALGVCLYESLTGVRPFEGESMSRIFERILARDFVPPRAVRPQLPQGFEGVCLKAMEADPKRRYAGASELARDLDRVLGGRPPAGRRWAALAAGVSAMVLAAGVFFATRVEGERREREVLRRIEDRVKPLEHLILETRPFSYIKDADVAGRLDKVRATVKELESLAADPRAAAHPDLWRALGVGEYFVGDVLRAEESLRRAAASAPGDGAVHYYLGRLYLDRAIIELLTPPGRPEAERRERSRAWNEKAEDQLRRATTWEGAPELDRRVAEACLAFAKGDAAGAARLCREGLVRFSGKLGVEEFSRLLGVLAPPEERIAHLTRAIEFRPHYPWARLQRSGQYLAEGKPDLAIEDLDRAIALYPQFGYAYNDRGVARFAKGEYDAAIADFDEVLRLDPRNALALGNRALARAGRRDLGGAIADGTEAIALSPFPAPLILNRGAHRLASGDLDGALADAEQGLKLDPTAARGYTLRAGIRASKQEWAEAAADYEKALAIDPKHPEARAGRGMARLHFGDRTQARADFDAALRLQPALAAAWFNRGSMLAEEGDLDGAVADLTEALRHDPSHLGALITRGVAWESKGELDKAIEDYDDALRVDYRSYDALFNRGMTRLAQRQGAAAVKDLQGSLQLAPAEWNSRGLAESSLEEARKLLPE